MSDEVIPISTKRAFVSATSLPANSDLINSVCLICKEKIADLCVTCQSKKTTDTCYICRGGCGHYFHNHCLTGWLTKSMVCPACQKSWINDGAPFLVS